MADSGKTGSLFGTDDPLANFGRGPSESDILTLRAREQQELFNKRMSESAQNLPAADRAVFAGFARLGQALGGKEPVELTDQERNKFAVQKRANELMGVYTSAEDWNEKSPTQKSISGLRALGKAHAENGNLLEFANIQSTINRLIQADAQAKAALESVEAETEKTKAETPNIRAQEQLRIQELADMKEAAQRAKAGDTGMFVVADENGNFNFDVDDPEVLTGNVNPLNAVLKRSDGKGNASNYMTVEQWSYLKKVYDENKNATSISEADAEKGLLTNITGSERKEARQEIKDIQAQQRMLGRVIELFKELPVGTDPRAVISTTGGLVSLVNKVYNTAQGTLTAFAPQFTVGGVMQEDGTIKGGQLVSGLEGAASYFKDQIPEPDNLAELGIKAEQYRAMVMQMVYLDARLAEPGARQLSDADITNAMTRLGVRSADPKAVFKTLLQNFVGRNAETRLLVKQVRGLGKAHRLTSDRAEELIFGGSNNLAMLDEMEKQLVEVGNNYFGGTAGPVAPDPDAKPTGDGTEAPPMTPEERERLRNMVLGG